MYYISNSETAMCYTGCHNGLAAKVSNCIKLGAIHFYYKCHNFDRKELLSLLKCWLFANSLTKNFDNNNRLRVLEEYIDNCVEDKRAVERTTRKLEFGSE